MFFLQTRLQSLVYPAIALSLLCSVGLTFALDSLQLDLGRMEGPDWSVQDISLAIDLDRESKSHDAFKITIGEISHPLLGQPIKNASLNCLQGEITAEGLSCAKAQAEVNHHAFKRPAFNLTFNWNNASQLIEINTDKISLSSGDIALTFKAEGEQWRSTITAGIQDIEQLSKLIPQLGAQQEAWGVTGNFSSTVEMRGKGSDITDGAWTTQFSSINFADPDSAYFGEALTGSLAGKMALNDAHWQSHHQLALKQGAILTPWAYLGTETAPINLETDLRVDASFSKSMAIRNLHYSHPGIVEFQTSGDIALDNPDNSLELLQITTSQLPLEKLFNAYLQPVLAGTLWEGVSLTGKLQADLQIKQGEPERATIELIDIVTSLSTLTTNAPVNLYSLNGMSGTLNWARANAGNEPEASILQWTSGALYDGITLGPAELMLELAGMRFKLKKSVQIPVLDGYLQAELLDLDLAGESPDVTLKGYLAPISMRKLSVALGLPVLSGQLSGMIPHIAYNAGSLSIGGIALVKLFDGNVLIRNLKLDELLGVLPVFNADIELKGLDLQTLTETFSFGRITGKLDGKVNQLRLENWQPVSFDAWFATPDDDKGRHRISQKAVDNISNLGGAGISGAVSRSFLRFFEEFGYSKLGISCRLENGICQMGGVENAENGYYLVKGGGVPRIDIMGFNRETDWNLLIQKLKEITESESPTIE